MTDTFTKHYSDVQRITSMPVKGKREAFSPADKAVYFYLLSLQENAGKVFPSIPHLSRELGIPERTVKRCIKWLQDALLISAQRRFDNSNVYAVTPPQEVIRLSGSAGESINKVEVISGAFSAKAVEAVLSILRKMSVNLKAGDGGLENNFKAPPEASQEAPQAAASPAPYKTGDAKPTPLIAVPVKDDEPYYFAHEKVKKVDPEIEPW
ncbi:helix-turn-helix domain-containing protein [Pantoea sp. A4]|uniref:helix-turn-helix domain-containing protein n=1 Tax=Pantoea sp. A4 TaxID=1225184 RepID=UPI0003826695|nr:helix-turn-helix domain-containing protein [Pantoea sp. A4]